MAVKYVDIPFIEKKKCTWNVFVAARQIGKTYGIFKYLMNNRRRFIWMRRTTSELTRAIELGVFDKLNEKEHESYCIDYNKSEGIGWIYSDAEKTNQTGLAISMSTAKSYRGINYYNYTDLFFDEFIPEEGTRRSVSDGQMCIQAFETIFGNRELPPDNLPPMRVWLASNTIDLYDPILSELNLVEDVAYMKANNIKTKNNPERSLYLYCGTERSVAEAKELTSLYKFLGTDAKITKQILYGEFKNDDISLLKPTANLKMYVCLFEIDNEVFVYMHKNDCSWYVSEKKQDCKLHFTKNKPSEIRKNFMPKYNTLTTCEMIYYEKAYLIQYLRLLLG